MSPSFLEEILRKVRSFLSWIFLCLLSSRPLLAGPPFVTDDPEPVEESHFEINMAAQGSTIHGGGSGNLPNLDVNYGLWQDTQIHVGLYGPYDYGSGQGSHYGYGDTEFGLKYRFVEEDDEGWRPQVALYPSTDLPSGNAREGLGAGHRKIFLPLWLQKSVGDWESFGGGGYWLNQGTDDRDYWFVGWALLRKFSEAWTLGGEIFHQSADLRAVPAPSGNGLSDRASTGFNLGGYYNLDEDDHIIFTFGRGLQAISGTNQFSYYVGYQVVF